MGVNGWIVRVDPHEENRLGDELKKSKDDQR